MSKFNCKVTFEVKMETTEPIESDSPFYLQDEIIKKVNEGENLKTKSGNGLKVKGVVIKKLEGKVVEE